mgnify:CR=1 FL=1
MQFPVDRSFLEDVALEVAVSNEDDGSLALPCGVRQKPGVIDQFLRFVDGTAAHAVEGVALKVDDEKGFPWHVFG